MAHKGIACNQQNNIFIFRRKSTSKYDIINDSKIPLAGSGVVGNVPNEMPADQMAQMLLNAQNLSPNNPARHNVFIKELLQQS